MNLIVSTLRHPRADLTARSLSMTACLMMTGWMLGKLVVSPEYDV